MTPKAWKALPAYLDLIASLRRKASVIALLLNNRLDALSPNFKSDERIFRIKISETQPALSITLKNLKSQIDKRIIPI